RRQADNPHAEARVEILPRTEESSRQRFPDRLERRSAKRFKRRGDGPQHASSSRESGSARLAGERELVCLEGVVIRTVECDRAGHTVTQLRAGTTQCEFATRPITIASEGDRALRIQDPI